MKINQKDKQDTKECINGHKMTGIGFDDCCPECEEPWKQEPMDWEKEFEINWGEVKGFCNALEDLEGKEYIRDFIENLLARQKEELREKIVGWCDDNGVEVLELLK